MKPETALANWQQWRGGLLRKPEIVSQLGSGRSNQSFLLDSRGTRIVLRLNTTDDLLPGSNRLAEAEIWQAASARGIAPPLLYIDERSRFLVSAFIQSDLPPRAPAKDTVIDRVFELMTQCHSLRVNAPTLDYARHIEHYWRMINKRGLTTSRALVRQRAPMQELLESLRIMGAQTALCHHDPVVANFVGNADRLYLIDWEYAARGMAVMDYAALAVEWRIDDAAVVARSGIEPELLAMAKELYRYLCGLWEVVSRWTPGQARGDVALGQARGDVALGRARGDVALGQARGDK